MSENTNYQKSRCPLGPNFKLAALRADFGFKTLEHQKTSPEPKCIQTPTINIQDFELLQEKSNILQDPKTSEGAFEDKLFKVKSIKHTNMNLRTQMNPETVQPETLIKIQESKKKRTQLEKHLQIGPGSRMNLENDLNSFVR